MATAAVNAERPTDLSSGGGSRVPPMNTKPYDQAFKYLAEKDAEALLILLGEINPGEDAQVSMLPREVSVAAQFGSTLRGR